MSINDKIEKLLDKCRACDHCKITISYDTAECDTCRGISIYKPGEMVYDKTERMVFAFDEEKDGVRTRREPSRFMVAETVVKVINRASKVMKGVEQCKVRKD